MSLQLDKQFKITIDSSRQNLQLEKLQPIIDKKTREVVREGYGIIGFHGLSMKSVLIQYRNAALISDEKLETLHDVLDRLNEIEDIIVKAVKDAKIVFGTKQDD